MSDEVELGIRVGELTAKVEQLEALPGRVEYLEVENRQLRERIEETDVAVDALAELVVEETTTPPEPEPTTIAPRTEPDDDDHQAEETETTDQVDEPAKKHAGLLF
jgi:hypothetical protein